VAIEDIKKNMQKEIKSGPTDFKTVMSKTRSKFKNHRGNISVATCLFSALAIATTENLELEQNKDEEGFLIKR
jgi:hypothetical protein